MNDAALRVLASEQMMREIYERLRGRNESATLAKTTILRGNLRLSEAQVGRFIGMTRASLDPCIAAEMVAPIVSTALRIGSASKCA
jgi:hypothetical protein